MASKSFQIGDLVWAKMRGFPAWPGEISVPPTRAKGKKSQYYVLFYGARNYAWISDNNIEAHNNILMLKYTKSQKRSPSYINAIQEIINVSKNKSRCVKNPENGLGKVVGKQKESHKNKILKTIKKEKNDSKISTGKKKSADKTPVKSKAPVPKKKALVSKKSLLPKKNVILTKKKTALSLKKNTVLKRKAPVKIKKSAKGKVVIQRKSPSKIKPSVIKRKAPLKMKASTKKKAPVIKRKAPLKIKASTKVKTPIIKRKALIKKKVSIKEKTRVIKRRALTKKKSPTKEKGLSARRIAASREKILLGRRKGPVGEKNISDIKIIQKDANVSAKKRKYAAENKNADKLQAPSKKRKYSSGALNSVEEKISANKKAAVEEYCVTTVEGKAPSKEDAPPKKIAPAKEKASLEESINISTEKMPFEKDLIHTKERAPTENASAEKYNIATENKSPTEDSVKESGAPTEKKTLAKKKAVAKKRFLMNMKTKVPLKEHIYLEKSNISREKIAFEEAQGPAELEDSKVSGEKIAFVEAQSPAELKKSIITGKKSTKETPLKQSISVEKASAKEKHPVKKKEFVKKKSTGKEKVPAKEKAFEEAPAPTKIRVPIKKKASAKESNIYTEKKVSAEAPVKRTADAAGKLLAKGGKICTGKKVSAIIKAPVKEATLVEKGKTSGNPVRRRKGSTDGKITVKKIPKTVIKKKRISVEKLSEKKMKKSVQSFKNETYEGRFSEKNVPSFKNGTCERSFSKKSVPSFKNGTCEGSFSKKSVPSFKNGTCEAGFSEKSVPSFKRGTCEGSSSGREKIDDVFSNLIRYIPPNYTYYSDAIISFNNEVNMAAKNDYETSSSNMSSGSANSKKIHPTDKKIGFLDLSKVGQKLVKNLLDTGHSIKIWNRTHSKCNVFEGAEQADTSLDIIKTCDIIFSCMSNPEAAKELILSEFGVQDDTALSRSSSEERKGFVDLTSLDPQTSQDINNAITIKGGRYLEAHFSGKRDDADDGYLLVITAGDRSLFNDCESCFLSVVKNSLYLSDDVGVAAKFNIAQQTVLGTIYAGLAECLILIDRIGLNPHDYLNILSKGLFDGLDLINNGYEMISNRYNENNTLRHMKKKIKLALNLGNNVELSMPVTCAAYDCYDNNEFLYQENCENTDYSCTER